MIRVMLWEAEPEQPSILFRYIERFFCNYHIKYKIHLFSDPESAAHAAPGYDLAFVDADLPGTDIPAFLSRLRRRNPDLFIFIVTSSDRFLDEAIHLHVSGYLTRPIDPKRLTKNISYALEEYYRQERSVVVHINCCTRRIWTREIVYITTANRKSRIRTPQGEALCDEPLADLSHRLADPQHFAFSHTSFLVNLAYVVQFDRTSVTVRIDDRTTETLHMSQRKYADFKNAFLGYMETAQ